MTADQQQFLESLSPHQVFQLLEDIYFIDGPQTKMGEVRRVTLARARMLDLDGDNGVNVGLFAVSMCHNTRF